MYVPPFVPQQIEIPGNVAEEGYFVRLAFIRRVVYAHFLTVLIAAGISLAPLPPAGALSAGTVVLVVLVLLSIIRGLAKGRHADQGLSILVLPVLLFALGLWLRALHDAGWPAWAPGIGVAFALLYTSLCGRDLSFVGMFVMAWLVSSIAIGIACWQMGLSLVSAGAALSLNGGFLLYYVYDLAALLTRRRLGEEWGAVVDLYRDVLNGIAYPIRVYHHWRKHNIWGSPKDWLKQVRSEE